MKTTAPILLLTLALGCSGSDDDDDTTITPPDGALTYKPCSRDTLVGGFDVTLADQFTSVQGQVASGVFPNLIPMVVDTIGECELLRPRALFCDPACPAAMTCGEGGVCVDRPENIDLKTIKVDGLTAAVEMNASAPVFFYTFRDTLPHPAFAPGDDISLTGEGIALRGFGVEPLVPTATVVPMNRGQALSLQWNAAANPGPTKVRIDLNIANHGGNPGNVVCHVDDDGSFEVPSSMVDALLDLGFSGFPSVGLTRRSVDRTDISAGCIEFRVRSETVLDVDIDGLTSCSGPEDCPGGQTCRMDLTCG